MEQQLNELMAGGGDYTKALQRQQADLATNIDHLKTRLLQIQGQIEEATHRNRTLLEENQAFQQQLDAQMASLVEQDKKTKELLKATSDQVSTITLTLEQEAKLKQERALKKAAIARQKALDAEKARQKAKADLRASQNKSTIIELKPRMVKGKSTQTKPATLVPAPTKPAAQPSATAKTTAEKLYDKGLSNYRAQNYKAAIKNFEIFLKDNPSHKLLPNAKYWLGSSRLKDGDYSGAVLEFQHIVADYPRHPKAPEALLKQAEAFGHFGDKMVQEKLYKDVISYYPKTEQAKTAKTKLKKLKK
jgi:tol-pal system protein YbgF